MRLTRRALLVLFVALGGMLATAGPAAASVPLHPSDVVGQDDDGSFVNSVSLSTTPIGGIADGGDLSSIGTQEGGGIVVPEPEEVPGISVDVSTGDGALSQTVVIILLLTLAAVAPGLLILTTSFTRFAIVLGLTRNALGSQNVPPTQVLVGLSLFLTLFVMGPVLARVNDDAIQPLLAGEIDQTEAFDLGFAPLRDFMLDQTDTGDLALFMGVSGGAGPETVADVSATSLIPAFIISELRTAFIIGFVIFVPFLVIDLIVSAVLMSMGMVMLPPVFISLPLKILLFVLVDGWALIIGSVVSSVQGVA